MVRVTKLLTFLVTTATSLSIYAKSNTTTENKDGSELCRIGQNYYKQEQKPIPSCKDLANLSLPVQNNTRITIDKNSIILNGKIFDCLKNTKEMNQLLSNHACSKDLVTLKYQDQTYKFSAKPLGRGERGTVYPLVETDKVIKIPKNDAKSLRILQEEKASSDFWYEASKKPGMNFSVPQKFSEHPLGYFSVMERIHGKTLTDVLIQLKIMHISKSHHAVAMDLNPALSPMKKKSLKKIERAIVDLVKVFRQNPNFSLSISPNNILVSFRDADKMDVDKVYLIDFGLDSGYHTDYSKTKSFEHYLATAREKIEGYLKRYPEQFNS